MGRGPLRDFRAIVSHSRPQLPVSLQDMECRSADVLDRTRNLRQNRVVRAAVYDPIFAEATVPAAIRPSHTYASDWGSAFI